MAAFVSVLIALTFTSATWMLERTQRVTPRMSGLMLVLAGIALGTFALANLLLVEEPVHALSGSLATIMIVGGAWRLRRTDFGVERVEHVLQEPGALRSGARRPKHPRGH